MKKINMTPRSWAFVKKLAEKAGGKLGKMLAGTNLAKNYLQFERDMLGQNADNGRIREIADVIFTVAIQSPQALKVWLAKYLGQEAAGETVRVLNEAIDEGVEQFMQAIGKDDSEETIVKKMDSQVEKTAKKLLDGLDDILNRRFAASSFLDIIVEMNREDGRAARFAGLYQKARQDLDALIAQKQSEIASAEGHRKVALEAELKATRLLKKRLVAAVRRPIWRREPVEYLLMYAVRNGKLDLFILYAEMEEVLPEKTVLNKIESYFEGAFTGQDDDGYFERSCEAMRTANQNIENDTERVREEVRLLRKARSQHTNPGQRTTFWTVLKTLFM